MKFRTKKSLGQNFLIDTNILNKITDIKNIGNSVVLEIDPGSGNLTSFIQKKNEFLPIVKELLYQDKLINSVRLLGISFSNLDTEKKAPVLVQLKLDL